MGARRRGVKSFLAPQGYDQVRRQFFDLEGRKIELGQICFGKKVAEVREKFAPRTRPRSGKKIVGRCDRQGKTRGGKVACKNSAWTPSIDRKIKKYTPTPQEAGKYSMSCKVLC